MSQRTFTVPASNLTALIRQRTNRTPAQEWMDAAVCTKYDPEWWFPIGSESTVRPTTICHHCPVRLECAADALAFGEKHGIRAGYDLRHHAQRRALRRAVTRGSGSEVRRHD